MKAHKGFTLIELIVVIGILVILMGIIISNFGGAGESARAAKCLANMKNLATAVQSCAAAGRLYPKAGSTVYMDVDVSKGRANRKIYYHEQRGWISWASQNHFPTMSKGGVPSISLYTRDETDGLFALTNGALWRYVSGGRQVYVCPSHAQLKSHVRWSYLMNAYFGWSADENYAYKTMGGILSGSLGNADRVLLFAEVPFQGAGEWFPSGEGDSMDTDAILQYKGCKNAPPVAGDDVRDGDEHIGANHKMGSSWYAHVVFADGHVEKFRAVSGKNQTLGSNELRKLTTFLCTGKAVTFTGEKYEELN